jgi:ZF-HD class homeobox domain-containing protein
MDFDDHDEAEEEEEEEMGVPPVASGYQLPPIMLNSTGPKPLNSAPGPEPVPGIIPGPRKTPTGSSGVGSRYRECLKNHAVGIGGHAVDGCGEFMAAGEEGTIDALRCAACNCHRNFHRKETDGTGGPGPSSVPPGTIVDPSTTYHQPHPQFSPYYRTPAGYLHHHHMAAAAAAAANRPVQLALPSTSGGGGHSRDEGEDVSHPMGMMALGGSGSGGMMMGIGASGSGSGSASGKKRFRSKFTQEQKDKMLAFAEKVGWRIQKHDEQAVQQFCNEVSVKRHVLKVWMHNNKHTLGKKP